MDWTKVLQLEQREFTFTPELTKIYRRLAEKFQKRGRTQEEVYEDAFQGYAAEEYLKQYEGFRQTTDPQVFLYGEEHEEGRSDMFLPPDYIDTSEIKTSNGENIYFEGGRLRKLLEDAPCHVGLLVCDSQWVIGTPTWKVRPWLFIKSAHLQKKLFDTNGRLMYDRLLRADPDAGFYLGQL